MIEKVVTYNGARITLKRANVRSRMLGMVINGRLNINEDSSNVDYFLADRYAQFLTQTTIEGDVGFYVPLSIAEAADLQAGYQAFYEAPVDFFDAVVIPLKMMDVDVNEVILLPDTPEKKA